MKKFAFSLLAFGACLGLVGLASGQVGGGRFGGMGGAGGRMDALALLRNASVKKELDVSDEQMEKVPEAVMKALGDVLNSKQLVRLKEIELQQRGTTAFSDAKIQDSLKLTNEQRESVKTILDDSKKEMAELAKGAGGKGGFGGGGANAEKLDGMRKEAQDKINGVLTADQRKAWRAMLGDTFKIEVPQFGGAGGNKGKNKKAADQ